MTPAEAQNMIDTCADVMSDANADSATVANVIQHAQLVAQLDLGFRLQELTDAVRKLEPTGDDS